MYPFNVDRPFIRNAWYPAAFSGEVGRTLKQRTIMDEPILLYRTQAGVAQAMWGLCPHRNYPLVEGRLVGDELQCSYHGYRFAIDGSCTRIPGQATVPSRFSQRVYPCIEKAGLVWVWMGRAEQADASLLPPLHKVGGDQAGWISVPNELTIIPARWSLMIDNLMDLSHIGFLHLKTIEAEAAGEASPSMSSENRFLVSRRLTNDDTAKMPYRLRAIEDPGRKVEAEVGTEFFTPAFLVTYMKFFDAQTGDELGRSFHYQGVTPETANTTLGFSLLVRNFQIESRDFDNWLKKAVSDTRAEDAAALSLVEKYAERYADAKRELSGINDVAAIRVRRHLAQLLEAEHTADVEAGRA